MKNKFATYAFLTQLHYCNKSADSNVLCILNLWQYYIFSATIKNIMKTTTILKKIFFAILQSMFNCFTRDSSHPT